MEVGIQHTHPNVSKSGLTISERHKSSNKILNCQRSMPVIVHNINSSNRLVGGADEEFAVEETFATISPESVQNVPNPSPSPPIPSTSPSSLVEKSLNESAQLEEDSQNKQLLPASGPCCFCSPQTSGLVGDRKVDEIIEYVHQNLAEAGKALASLGENFEHDIKMMFIDILGRIKQWTGIVQNKLGICKNEVDNLRKELLARACEIDVKTRELKNIKAQFAEYQNDLLSNSELLKKKDLNKKYRLEPKEQREASIREDLLAMEDAQAANAKKIMRATRAADEDEDEQGVQAEKEVNRIKKINAKKIAALAADQDEEDVQVARAVDQTNEEEDEGTRDVNRIDEEDEERAIDRIMRTDEDEEESLKRRVKKRKMKDIAYTSTMIQTDVQEKERIKREFELESEVKRLRKEYDRVMKERAQYESAIQRALLRGVSSLNVEALRVLRCPPIPCCIPRALCPVTTGIIPPEPVVLCPGKSKKRHSKSAVATVSSAKVSCDKNIQNDDQTDCTTKQPSTSLCCSVNRNRKSNIALMRKKCSDGSMVFLLHQDDARNLDVSDKVCGSTIMKKIEIPPLPKFRI